jgi:hypothetical protein
MSQGRCQQAALPEALGKTLVLKQHSHSHSQAYRHRQPVPVSLAMHHPLTLSAAGT